MLKSMLYDAETGLLVPAPTRDSMTNAANVIDYAHHEAHGGSAYSLHVTDGDLDADENIDIVFRTARYAKWLHLMMAVEVSVGAIAYFYEGATSDNDGTPLTPRNRLRSYNDSDPDQSTITSVKLGDGNVAVGAATLLASAYVGAGKKVGGGTRETEEWILRDNEVYLFRVDSLAAENIVSVKIDWYEHRG